MPEQRRLSQGQIEPLMQLYMEGASIDGLARRYGLHRTTVIHHLDEAGITRRRAIRKMTDELIAVAAARYEQGASLAAVASEFGVHQRTLARELRQREHRFDPAEVGTADGHWRDGGTPARADNSGSATEPPIPTVPRGRRASGARSGRRRDPPRHRGGPS